MRHVDYRRKFILQSQSCKGLLKTEANSLLHLKQSLGAENELRSNSKLSERYPSKVNF